MLGSDFFRSILKIRDDKTVLLEEESYIYMKSLIKEAAENGLSVVTVFGPEFKYVEQVYYLRARFKKEGFRSRIYAAGMSESVALEIKW